MRKYSLLVLLHWSHSNYPLLLPVFPMSRVMILNYVIRQSEDSKTSRTGCYHNTWKENITSTTRFHAREFFLDFRLVNQCITSIKLYQDLLEETVAWSRYPKKHLSSSLSRERKMFSLSLQKFLSTVKGKVLHPSNKLSWLIQGKWHCNIKNQTTQQNNPVQFGKVRYLLSPWLPPIAFCWNY